MKKLTATTPVGTFTRRTNNPYKFVVVHQHGVISGTGKPWMEVTWHSTRLLAEKALRSRYSLLRSKGDVTTIVDIYPVD